ncbi:hypothetical protein JOQ06_010288 [Pogonophryne albipinna]|uniref:Ig-like domain-containing protein n=1 Tax=Pogonophryne albipinna TaxID=1090488 RepID=A0AAD6AWA4_9TELE|nr:hypothetical protein JOQ06_010288 [Pogonophryne albipinna]
MKDINKSVCVHMMKGMSLFSDVSTQRRVFGWVSIIWFTAGIAVSHGLELHTVSQVAARQHDDPKVKCEYIVEPPQILTLILLNVMPSDQGKYLCKLRSSHGMKSNTTDVKVQDCLETSGYDRNESYAECWFNGVYPGGGSVRWSQGELNFTAPAFYQKEEMDHHGRYNILSQLDVQKGNLNQPYTCSLWMPSTSKALFSHELHVVKKLKGSSESMVTLQWICLIMEIIMVKCMT